MANVDFVMDLDGYFKGLPEDQLVAVRAEVVGAFPHGMTSGAPSAAILATLPDGRRLMVEISLRLLLVGAGALQRRYFPGEDPSDGVTLKAQRTFPRPPRTPEEREACERAADLAAEDCAKVGPLGWYCNRAPGHSPPCVAASQGEGVLDVWPSPAPTAAPPASGEPTHPAPTVAAAHVYTDCNGRKCGTCSWCRGARPGETDAIRKARHEAYAEGYADGKAFSASPPPSPGWDVGDPS